MWQVLDKDIEQEESVVDLSSEGHGEAVISKRPKCKVHLRCSPVGAAVTEEISPVKKKHRRSC